ncbi:MAG: methionyl-tRNA formyltransferase, partial [Treponema sp.]|nr:methionyl-tRNA formyltransferase [Treponema sp.]
VLTNPDRARKHGYSEPSDISAAAAALDAVRGERGLPPLVQFKPEKLDARAREEIAAAAPDLLVSFAYGRMFGPRFLALFPRGGINIHPSLLPKYRGAAPIPAAILARDKESGICIQTLAEAMDSGDILAHERFELNGRETTASLSEDVSRRAAGLLCALLADFDAARARAWPQTGTASYCAQIKKDDGRIDWSKSAVEIDAQVRAYTPWPLSFTQLDKNALFILQACPVVAMEDGGQAAAGSVLGIDKELGVLIQTGSGVLAVSRLQWQAKKALDWKDFLNGARDFVGARLG